MSSSTEADEKTGFRSSWHRSRRSLQQIGLFYTLQAGLKNVVPARFMSWRSFFLIDSIWPDASDADVSEEGIRMARPTDAARLEKTNGLARRLQECLDRDCKISICEMDGEITGVYVYDTSSHEYWDWLRFDLADDVLWATSVWVKPGQRGQDLLGRMRSFNARNLKSRGYNRVVAIVEARNIPSLRATLKIANIARACTYLRLFNFTMVWFDGQLSIGFWRPDNRLVVHSDELHLEPGEKLGRHKVRMLQRHIYGRESQARPR